MPSEDASISSRPETKTKNRNVVKDNDIECKLIYHGAAVSCHLLRCYISSRMMFLSLCIKSNCQLTQTMSSSNSSTMRDAQSIKLYEPAVATLRMISSHHNVITCLI
jgi:hypothetical protein